MQQHNPRAGQVALVTGGSSALGYAIAQALAEAGTTVVVTSPDAGFLMGAVLSVDGGWTAR